ncbi:bile acid:sodium symporter [Malaciobacter molluscorum LMG 25693]|uniref:Bile acid:sodium symporter n=1 Tax=Malaciobacter molluscorum LMG 25693 TaxID=870501 RepID=A0A2G1DHS4_9BACT|nr:bile acid:sodium symporter family protein [Malaciobacter molluscorum]AXX93330.1 bile acid:sodium symporter family protein [Malaciobacter molluscorum LMG 25693]PHO17984.1 bile acid:sodium symporter [Malaciobacter molluscorum LMG 25693]
MIKLITILFPLWAIIFSSVCYIFPDLVIGFKNLIIPLLMFIMFCMGITLKIDDFKRVLKKPKIIALTTILQFLLMPLAAYIVSKIFNLSTELLVGMVLVGAVSGGTASNVIAYLAKADVALSISMTIVSTLLSIIITPYLTLFYIGHTVQVPVNSMLLSIFKVVFIPVIVGIILNHFFHKYIDKRQDIFALFSIISIVFIIGIIIGINENKISLIATPLMLAIICHNLIGLFGGYIVCKSFGYNKKECKTVAIEVGMQNSGLAVVLATKYFSALSALPGAIFSIWHNISGSILAGYWSKQKD